MPDIIEKTCHEQVDRQRAWGSSGQVRPGPDQHRDLPEGLPTVVTSLLASGIRTLQKRQIYARRFDVIESLGARAADAGPQRSVLDQMAVG